MTATIYLKEAARNIIVENFSSVKFSNGTTSRNIKPDNLENFSLHKSIAYIFFGKTTVAVSGSDILYVEFK